MIMGVRYVQIFGTGIKMGDFATLITSPDAHIHLTTWISGGYEGKITIGDFCLISPGVRISAATNIEIGNSCMFANNAYDQIQIGTIFTIELNQLDNLNLLN